MAFDEILHDSDETRTPADNSGPVPEKQRAADEMTEEIKAWADTTSSRPHALGGILCLARNTEAGELIGIAALGTKRMQLQMLIKLLEQLDRSIVNHAISYQRMSPLERIFVDVLMETRDEMVSKGAGRSDESLKKAVQNTKVHEPAPPE